MEYTQLQPINTHINPVHGTQLPEAGFDMQQLGLQDRVQTFNNRLARHNAEVTIYNDNSMEYRKDKKDLAGLDTAVKVMFFIAIAAIIAFVVLISLSMAIPMIAFTATAIAAGAGMLLAAILEVAHTVINGKVKEGEEKFAPQSGRLSTADLAFTAERADIEAQIAARNQANPVGA